MKPQTIGPACLAITESVLETVAKVIEAELAYERATNCGRKFGITGEVGEILICRALGLELVNAVDTVGSHQNPHSAGPHSDQSPSRRRR